jgi:Uma2 family endonuclease
MRFAPITTLPNLEQYLEFEQNSLVRHEFVDGFVFEMAGATQAHNLISGNIFVVLKLAAKGKPCRVFQSDMKLLVDGKVYYPDVFVTCNAEDDGKNIKQFPCLILEVLSSSTKDIDRSEKWESYQKLPSLEMYALVHQDKARVEVYKRLPDQTWHYTVLEREQKLDLPCAGVSTTLAEIYEDVL